MDDHAHEADDASRRSVVRALVDSARRQAHDTGARAAAVPTRRTSPPPQALPGYEIVDELHRGGQGVVYRARQTSTGRTVAVKVMHEGPFAGPRDRARFEREVQILAQLKHPNIVGILDSGTAAGSAYFVMDYILGHPLDRWLAERAPPQNGRAPAPIAQTLTLFARVCDAVHAAHLRGVVHRDLKPNNILVDDSGEPHILDLGLARLDAPGAAADALTLTTTGHFMGSLPWASPEQAAGATDRIDLRTDVYSLGVMLYVALTGRFPCDVRGSFRDVLERIIHDPPPRPSTVCRGLDDELDTILLKCLAKEPERRYESAGALAADLRHYLADEPIDAKRDSAWYVLRKTVRRYRMPLAVATLFLVVLTASTIVAAVLYVRAHRAAADARRAGLAAAAAEQQAVDHLHASLVDQARSVRRTVWAGHRFDALDALRRAAQIRPTLEIRNEAIAALALVDARPQRQLARPGACYFDPDFSAVALADPDGGSTILRLADESEIMRLAPPAGGLGEMHHVALRGKRLARLFDPPAGPRRLEVWSVPDGNLVLALDDVPFRARFDISPDGRRLAVGRLDRAIHFYDIESGRELQRIPLDRDPSYLTFDPSGTRLALYHGNFLDAEILDLATGDRQPAFDDAAIGWSVAWNPDGRLLAGAADRSIVLWDADTRRRAAVLTDHEDQIVHLLFSHDGKLLLSHSWDGYSVLWDVAAGRPLLRFGMARPVFSPDEKLIAGGVDLGRGVITRILTLQDESPRRRLVAGPDVETRVNSGGAFDPATGLLLMADAVYSPGNTTLRVFDPQSGRELTRQGLSGRGTLAVDPAGRCILLAHASGLLRLPLRVDPDRLAIGPPTRLSDTPAERAALTTDGNVALAVSGSSDELTVLDLRSGAHRSIDYEQRCADVRLSPDGRWVALTLWYGSRAEVWDAASGLRAAELRLDGNAAVAFSPDARRLYTSDDTDLVVWETGTWRALHRRPQPGRLLCVSPDGRTLAFAVEYTRIRLLDADTLEEMATLEPPESYHTQSCAYSPDGTLLAQFTNRAGIVHLWDLRRLRADLAVLGLDWNAAPLPPGDNRLDPSREVVIDLTFPRAED